MQLGMTEFEIFAQGKNALSTELIGRSNMVVIVINLSRVYQGNNIFKDVCLFQKLRNALNNNFLLNMNQATPGCVEWRPVLSDTTENQRAAVKTKTVLLWTAALISGTRIN